MRKYMISSAGILVIIVLLFCIHFYKRPIPQSNISLSLSKVYTSIDEIKKDASDIVEVKVLSNETIEYAEVTFTLSKVRILNPIITKSNLKKGDEITIIETGGIIELPENQAKKIGSKKLNLTVDGISVVQPGEKNILAIQKFIGPQAKNAFVPLGVYQGKFKENKDGFYEQLAPESIKLKEYTPLKKEDLIKKLKQ